MEEQNQEAIVTPKKVDAYTPFAVILKRIYIRLVAEGYIMKDGQLHKSEKMLEMEEELRQEKKSRSSRKS